MVVFSTLKSLFRNPSLIQNAMARRTMSDHRIFPLEPSRWQWTKFKDYFHFYVMIGLIPCTLAVLGANVFVGPATLSEIPEDYVPKYWEYYRNPITRFLARYVYTDPQQEYEKFCSYAFMEDEKRKLRALETQIKQKMGERKDYQAYYYRPVMAKYHRITKEAADYLETVRGD